MKDYIDYSNDERIQKLMSNPALKEEELNLILDIVEQSQDQQTLIENQSSRIQDQAKQIQKLSSDKQNLSSTVQMLGNKVQQQSEQIETLNDSDKQLQEARKQRDEAVKKLEEANRKSEEAKDKVLASDASQAVADEKYAEAEEQKRKNDLRAKNLDKEVKKRAAEITKEKKKKLEDDYKTQTLVYKMATKGPTVYAIIITILMATRTDELPKAAWRVLCGLGTAIAWTCGSLFDFLNWISESGSEIEQPVLSVLVSFFIPVGLLVVLGYGIYKLGRYGIPWAWDKINPYFDIHTLWIALVLVIINVIYGDIIIEQGGNPVGIGLVSFIFLFAIRCWLFSDLKRT